MQYQSTRPGGFSILAIDKEGHDVAKWLNEHGVVGIVVKYRLPDPAGTPRNAPVRDTKLRVRVGDRPDGVPVDAVSSTGAGQIAPFRRGLPDVDSMPRYRLVRQNDESDCGAAALATVALQ